MVSALFVFSFSIQANLLKCTGSSIDQKVSVEALVEENAEAQIKLFYSKTNYTNEQFLTFSEGVYYYNYGDSCTNQETGLEEYILSLKNDSASLIFSWCDDDGGSGFEEYELTCTKK